MIMNLKFTDWCDQLLASTPEHLSGSVVVDQVYAHYQHAHPEFHHPRGGQAFYLQEPLYLKHKEYYTRLGHEAVRGRLVEAMIKNVDDLATEVYHRAPWEFNVLRNSAHARVYADGVEVYSKGPKRKRMSESELRAEHHSKPRYLDHRKKGKKG